MPVTRRLRLPTTLPKRAAVAKRGRRRREAKVVAVAKRGLSPTSSLPSHSASVAIAKRDRCRREAAVRRSVILFFRVLRPIVFFFPFAPFPARPMPSLPLGGLVSA